MLFDEDAFYTFKVETPNNSVAYLRVQNFYKTITEPLPLLTLLVGLIGWSSTKIIPMLIKQFDDGDRNAFVTSTLYVVTLAIVCRIVQSIFLARKDYGWLNFDFGDFITFFLLLFFTCGRVFVWFGTRPFWIIVVYAVFSFAALVHFVRLGVKRIPADKRHYDIDIEKKIQIVNAVVFSFLLIILVSVCISVQMDHSGSNLLSCLLLLSIIPLMMFNMHHSYQLTMWPKLSINNKCLDSRKIGEYVDSLIEMDNDIFRGIYDLKDVLSSYKNRFKPITMRRAMYQDTKFISDLYIKNFSYVIKDLFPHDGFDIEHFMIKALQSGFGLGTFGYLRFYIIECDGSACGFIMPEFHMEPTLYEKIGTISSVSYLLRRIGLRKVLRLLRDLKALRLLQPRPDSSELRIKYIAFVENKTRQGNGFRVLCLLKQAFMKSSVNGFHAQTISAYVRESNTASVRLFEKAGFIRHDIIYSAAWRQPLESAGALVNFTIDSE